MTRSNFSLNRTTIKRLIIVIFISIIIITGVILDKILNHNAESQITREASLLMKTMNSIRDYTSEQITPQLEEKLEQEFLPQIIPSYAATEIFNITRTDKNWKSYSYKEAMLNPTNVRDRADKFETEVINELDQNRQLQEVSGFVTDKTGEQFYIAQPIMITQVSCLQCHSTPDVAPKSMIEKYGSTNGFNWPLNQVMGAKIVYVPVNN